jgi:hypothetical protein
MRCYSVVFIHGITGHPYRTWAADKTIDPWIMALLPQAVPGARILTFGYHSQIVGVAGQVNQNTIRAHSQNLLNRLMLDEDRAIKKSVCTADGATYIAKILLADSKANQGLAAQVNLRLSQSGRLGITKCVYFPGITWDHMNKSAWLANIYISIYLGSLISQPLSRERISGYNSTNALDRIYGNSTSRFRMPTHA